MFRRITAGFVSIPPNQVKVVKCLTPTGQLNVMILKWYCIFNEFTVFNFIALFCLLLSLDSFLFIRFFSSSVWSLQIHSSISSANRVEGCLRARHWEYVISVVYFYPSLYFKPRNDSDRLGVSIFVKSSCLILLLIWVGFVLCSLLRT